MASMHALIFCILSVFAYDWQPSGHFYRNNDVKTIEINPLDLIQQFTESINITGWSAINTKQQRNINFQSNTSFGKPNNRRNATKFTDTRFQTETKNHTIVFDCNVFVGHIWSGFGGIGAASRHLHGKMSENKTRKIKLLLKRYEERLVECQKNMLHFHPIQHRKWQTENYFDEYTENLLKPKYSYISTKFALARNNRQPIKPTMKMVGPRHRRHAHINLKTDSKHKDASSLNNGNKSKGGVDWKHVVTVIVNLQAIIVVIVIIIILYRKWKRRQKSTPLEKFSFKFKKPKLPWIKHKFLSDKIPALAPACPQVNHQINAEFWNKFTNRYLFQKEDIQEDLNSDYLMPVTEPRKDDIRIDIDPGDGDYLKLEDQHQSDFVKSMSSVYIEPYEAYMREKYPDYKPSFDCYYDSNIRILSDEEKQQQSKSQINDDEQNFEIDYGSLIYENIATGDESIISAKSSNYLSFTSDQDVDEIESASKSAENKTLNAPNKKVGFPTTADKETTALHGEFSRNDVSLLRTAASSHSTISQYSAHFPKMKTALVVIQAPKDTIQPAKTSSKRTLILPASKDLLKCQSIGSPMSLISEESNNKDDKSSETLPRQTNKNDSLKPCLNGKKQGNSSLGLTIFKKAKELAESASENLSALFKGWNGENKKVSNKDTINKTDTWKSTNQEKPFTDDDDTRSSIYSLKDEEDTASDEVLSTEEKTGSENGIVYPEDGPVKFENDGSKLKDNLKSMKTPTAPQPVILPHQSSLRPPNHTPVGSQNQRILEWMNQQQQHMASFLRQAPKQNSSPTNSSNLPARPQIRPPLPIRNPNQGVQLRMIRPQRTHQRQQQQLMNRFPQSSFQARNLTPQPLQLPTTGPLSKGSCILNEPQSMECDSSPSILTDDSSSSSSRHLRIHTRLPAYEPSASNSLQNVLIKTNSVNPTIVGSNLVFGGPAKPKKDDLHITIDEPRFEPTNNTSDTDWSTQTKDDMSDQEKMNNVHLLMVSMQNAKQSHKDLKSNDTMSSDSTSSVTCKKRNRYSIYNRVEGPDEHSSNLQSSLKKDNQALHSQEGRNESVGYSKSKDHLSSSDSSIHLEDMLEKEHVRRLTLHGNDLGIEQFQQNHKSRRQSIGESLSHVAHKIKPSFKRKKKRHKRGIKERFNSGQATPPKILFEKMKGENLPTISGMPQPELVGREHQNGKSKTIKLPTTSETPQPDNVGKEYQNGKSKNMKLPTTSGMPQPDNVSREHQNGKSKTIKLPTTSETPQPGNVGKEYQNEKSKDMKLPTTSGMPNPDTASKEDQDRKSKNMKLPTTSGMPKPDNVDKEYQNGKSKNMKLPTTSGMPQPDNVSKEHQNGKSKTIKVPTTSGMPHPDIVSKEDQNGKSKNMKLPTTSGMPQPDNVGKEYQNGKSKSMKLPTTSGMPQPDNVGKEYQNGKSKSMKLPTTTGMPHPDIVSKEDQNRKSKNMKLPTTSVMPQSDTVGKEKRTDFNDKDHLSSSDSSVHLEDMVEKEHVRRLTLYGNGLGIEKLQQNHKSRRQSIGESLSHVAQKMKPSFKRKKKRRQKEITEESSSSTRPKIVFERIEHKTLPTTSEMPQPDNVVKVYQNEKSKSMKLPTNSAMPQPDTADKEDQNLKSMRLPIFSGMPPPDNDGKEHQNEMSKSMKLPKKSSTGKEKMYKRTCDSNLFLALDKEQPSHGNELPLFVSCSKDAESPTMNGRAEKRKMRFRRKKTSSEKKQKQKD